MVSLVECRRRPGNMNPSSVSLPPLESDTLHSVPHILPLHTFTPHINRLLHILASVPRSFENVLRSFREDALRLTDSATLFCGNKHLQWRNSFKRPVLVNSLCYLPYSHTSILSEAANTRNGANVSEQIGESKEDDEGPAFFGHVFSMWDTSETGLLGVRHDSKKNLINFPQFLPMAVRTLLERSFPGFFEVKPQEPVFKFYIDKVDAEKYVNHVGLAGSIVGSFPLDTAYKVYKENPSLFAFIPNKSQVKLARQMIRKLYGQKEAVNFQGVPVFTTHNLTICLLTSSGIKWFRPYFFDKRQLDILIGSSIDQHYRMLIRKRRKQRYTQGNDIDLLGDLPESDLEAFEPVEAQEFMEELGQGGIGSDSAVFKALNASIQDLLDNIIFGSRWSRQVIGIQPRFPVFVESFLQRAAAADLHDSNKVAQVGRNASSFESEPSQLRNGRNCTTGASSPRSGDNKHSAINYKKHESKLTTESKKPHEKFQGEHQSPELQLTIMGFASYGPTNISETSTFVKDLSAAANEMERKVSQVNKQEQELTPAFIADLKFQVATI